MVFDRWKTKDKPASDDPKAEGKPPASPDAFAGVSSDPFSDGLRLYEESKYDEALPAFEKAIQNDRRHEHAHYYKADALFRLGRFDEALKPAEDAVKLREILLREYRTRKESDRENEIMEQLARAYQLKGSILMKLARTAEATNAFSMVSKYYPRLALENPEFDGKYVEGLIMSIISYLGLGDSRQAQAPVEKSEEGESYRKAFRQAKELLDDYLKVRPHDIDALVLKGGIILEILEPGYADRSDFDEIKMAINKAVEFDPNHAPAHAIMGLMYQRSGVYTLALDSYDRAIRLFEDRITEITSTGAQFGKKSWSEPSNSPSKLPSWKSWDHVTLKLNLAYAMMGRSVALASDGREREALEYLELAERIHFDNFGLTAAPDDVNFVEARLVYAHNFLYKSLVDISIARINYRNRMNQNVVIKLEQAGRNIDMGLRFVVQLEKDLSAGKIRHVSGRQLLSLRTADANFKYLREVVGMNKVQFQNGHSPSFIQ